LPLAWEHPRGARATPGIAGTGRSLGIKLACALRNFATGACLMRFLNDPTFWDKKLRIALLALVSFMALC
jgi:hypothetical protein